MLMDMTNPLQHGAWLNILLAIFIILELGIFIAWLNYITIKMLVQPLTRILATLRKNARHVLNSVESEVGSNSHALPLSFHLCHEASGYAHAKAAA